MNNFHLLENLFDQFSQAQEQLQAFFPLTPDLLCVLQADGRFQLLSFAWESALGWDIQHLQAQSWLEWMHPDDWQISQCCLQSLLAQGSGAICSLINRMRHGDGSDRPLIWSMKLSGDGLIYATARIQTEGDLAVNQPATETIQASEEKFRQLTENIREVFFICPPDYSSVIYVSPAYEQLWGRSCASLYDHPKSWLEGIHPDDYERVIHALAQQFAGQEFNQEYRIVRPDGSIRWVAARTFLIYDETGQIYRLVGTAEDISDRKQAEIILKQQTERERLVTTITQRIRQSLDLTEILQTTVNQVRQLLQVDRVVIYQFNPDGSGDVIAESVSSQELTILGATIDDPCFKNHWHQPYLHGHIGAIEDIQSSHIQPCHAALLRQFQVQANLVVPILQGEVLWGLLIAHHCSAPRQWQGWEISLLQQLANQLAIALQQSELYQQVQLLNTTLEAQVQDRTAQLQKTLTFEALLKRITDKVRDSLDEQQILQTVVQELAFGLNTDVCDTGLYDLEQGISIITHEYVRAGFPAMLHSIVHFAHYPDLYQRLLQGEELYFCWLYPLNSDIRQITGKFAAMAYPLIDDQGVIGDLWLYKEGLTGFDQSEIRLVKQVANQCAIAIRQARLYQTAQQQVEELERLNRLKDDFLNTVSHELRSPMSNIKLATDMLEILLTQSGVIAIDDSPISRYFQILKEECQRETSLINDLLDLARLDAGTEPVILSTIEPQIWIAHVTEIFIERMRSQNQQLQLNIAESLPAITTDLSNLERILTELLHNACKYTPAGETIAVSVQVAAQMPIDAEAHRAKYEEGKTSFKLPIHSTADASLPTPALQICVTNTGVEIPESERDRIFEKFYRIPNNDPWRHGGTGLGLALVKKLVKRLAGCIVLESSVGQTTFSVWLPLTQVPPALTPIHRVTFNSTASESASLDG